jgi:hypothetical protein
MLLSGLSPHQILDMFLLFWLLIFNNAQKRLRVAREADIQRVNIYLEGTATFMQLPKLARMLDRVLSPCE